MTAEVGVLNPLGAALAADSALTRNGKVYTSADKLFQLVEDEPVGAMIYGGASFLDVPWETIIKMYRSSAVQQGTLREYAENFLTFLKDERKLFPEEAQKALVAELAAVEYAGLRENLRTLLERDIREKGSLESKEVESAFVEVVKSRLDALRKLERISSVPKDFGAQCSKTYRDTIAEAKKQVFSDFPIKAPTSRMLTSIVTESLGRKETALWGSGIVIAGFGDDEYFPSLIEIWINGLALNNLLWFERQDFRIGRDSWLSGIIPFAQRDMVWTFTHGVNPDLYHLFRSSVEELFAGLFDIVNRELTKEGRKKLGAQLVQRIQREVQKLSKGWDEIIQKQFSNPVAENISLLPKEELAAMAEALVNLTKFRRRVTAKVESVGGPIDVAVITKGDGFVWVKRKHYFRAELNPRVIKRLGQGGGHYG